MTIIPDPTRTAAQTNAETPDEIKLMAQRLCADHVEPFHEKEFLSELDKLMDAAAAKLRAELQQARAERDAVVRHDEQLEQLLYNTAKERDALRAELTQARAERDNWRTAKAESDDVIKAIVSALGSAESGMDVVEYAAHVRAQLAAAPAEPVATQLELTK